MSLLVISDTHLSGHFEPDKYEYLTNLISGATSVILNGDFWDGYEISFDDFLKSKWSGLFPLLKAKKAIYLFGNHDKEEFSDSRRELFCEKSCMQYELIIGGKKLYFEHGDRLVWKIDKILGIKRPPFVISSLTESLQSILIKRFGIKLFQWMFGYMNIEIKRQKKENKNHLECDFLFCGHVHCAEIDREIGYVNTGVFKYGHAQYATVSDDCDILLKLDRYDS